MGFIHVVASRRAAQAIERRVRDRVTEVNIQVLPNFRDVYAEPEGCLLYREKIDLMRKVLTEMPARDRDVLTRFYLHEETPEQVCKEMNLTETQFRLLKSRAKARFARLAQKHIADKRGSNLLSKVSRCLVL